MAQHKAAWSTTLNPIEQEAGIMSTPTFQNTAVKTVTFFRGDGIGPEISDAVMAIFKAAGVPVHFDVYDVGEAEYLRNGKLIPDAAFASLRRRTSADRVRPRATRTQ